MDNDIDLRGFIAIAPQDTIKFTKGQYQSVDVPVLLMYGERDKTPAKEESIYWMENIPDHTNVMIKKADTSPLLEIQKIFIKRFCDFYRLNVSSERIPTSMTVI